MKLLAETECSVAFIPIASAAALSAAASMEMPVSSLDMPMVIDLPVAPASVMSCLALVRSWVMSGDELYADWKTLLP